MPPRQVGRDDCAALIRWLTLRAGRSTGLEPDDLGQDAAVRLASARRPIGRAYVAKVVRSVVADSVWKRAYIARTERGAARPIAVPPPPALSDVREAVERLPAPLRDAVVLTYWRGLDHREAGRALGLHPTTVRNRLVVARRALAAPLAAYRPED